MSRQNSESDAAILKKVNQHLARMNCRVNAAIHNGQVTLSGNIQYDNQRRPALKAAGVVHVGRGRVVRAERPPHPLLVPPDLVHAVVVTAHG